MDISNGEGLGVSLFVQGCHFHCKNCFNQSTWDFNGGKEWTEESFDEFMKLVKNPHIKRVSILGGEPLADENISDVMKVCNEIRILYGNQKNIWIYSGYDWQDIFDKVGCIYQQNLDINKIIRRQIISQCDVMVDGRFVDELKDFSLKWKGSSNQRVIDVQKTLKNNKIELYCN